MRAIGSVVEADSVLGSRWQVSTQAPRIPESYKQIVPLAGGRKSRPLMGCRARCSFCVST